MGQKESQYLCIQVREKSYAMDLLLMMAVELCLGREAVPRGPRGLYSKTECTWYIYTSEGTVCVYTYEGVACL